jgi:hypothetical protein
MVFGEFKTITGSDVNQYRRDLTEKVSVNTNGGYGPVSFGAEVSKNFGDSRIQNSSYVFATYSINIAKGAYNIKSQSGLDAFFTNEFKTDLSNPAITAEKLVDKYGTHVMLGGIYGARLDHHLSTTAKNDKSFDKLGYYVKSSADVKFATANAGAGFSYDQQSEFEKYFETTETELKTLAFGGKPEYAQSINSNSGYNDWISSIDGNEIWSDYYPKSLLGIWELPMDIARSKGLQIEVELRCPPTKVVNAFPDTIITEWKMIRGDFQRITDAGPLKNPYDVVNFAKTFDVDLDRYKEKGYTKINFSIQMDMREIDDGYAWVYLYSSDTPSTSYQIASDMRDLNSDKQWRPEYITFLKIDINSFDKSFVIRYDGTGKNDDDWENKNVKVKLDFYK